jgi:hypothetical protein
MAIKRSATSKDSDRARKARLEARVKGTAKGLKTTTGQRRAVVSDIEARRAARTAVGRYSQGKPSRTVRGAKTGPIARLTPRGAITVSTPKKRAGITKTQNNPVTITRTTPKTREEIAKGIAQERYNRLTSVLRPIVSPSRKKGGKVFVGPKRGSTIEIAKPSAATTRAKKANPGDRKIDASRRTAMKAAEEARSKKTPAEREQEQRRDKTESRATKRSSVNDPQQREADRRVREGLKDRKKIDKLEGKKPAPRARTWGRGGRGMGGGMIGGGGFRGPVIR